MHSLTNREAPADTALFHLRRAVDQLRLCSNHYPDEWIERFAILEAEALSVAERTEQTVKQLRHAAEAMDKAPETKAAA